MRLTNRDVIRKFQKSNLLLKKQNVKIIKDFLP